MGSQAAKYIYKERAATAEYTNAQARNRGLRQFLVRGVCKVKSIALLHGLTHNMVCGSTPRARARGRAGPATVP